MGPTIRESRLWMLESHCFKLNMKLWQLISWVIICGRLATQIVKYIYKLTMMISKPYLQIFEGKVHCSAGGLSDLIHHVYERAIYIYIFIIWSGSHGVVCLWLDSIIALDVDANCGETHEFMIDKQSQPFGDQRMPPFGLPCNLWRTSQNLWKPRDAHIYIYSCLFLFPHLLG